MAYGSAVQNELRTLLRELAADKIDAGAVGAILRWAIDTDDVRAVDILNKRVAPIMEKDLPPRDKLHELRSVVGLLLGIK
jgi:hypothetical protein